MHDILTSNRLTLTTLAPADAEFILELVNTPGWIKFIGDRKVKTIPDAEGMVRKVIDNPNVNYWVVRTREQQTSLGIISLVKRDYLEFFDVGFAFLPQYMGQGYAHEAAMAFMHALAKTDAYPTLLATTLTHNSSSIALLIKLGFRFDKELTIENETLQVYAISRDQFLINQLTRAFFDVFTNKDQRKPDLDAISNLCLPEALIIKKSEAGEEIYNLQTFIEPRRKILSNGTLTDFEERENEETTIIVGGIAQRFSVYEKSGRSNGTYFKQRGNKFFQFVKRREGWKISAVIWEDELMK